MFEKDVSPIEPSEMSKETMDVKQKETFSAFGWDPAEFRKKSVESYYHDVLDRQASEFELEYEKYGDRSLYELSEETFSMEGPNCYAFAMQLPVNPLTGCPFESRPTPGEIAHGFDSEVVQKSSYLLNFGTPKEQKAFYSEMMKDDAEALGMSIKEVDRDYKTKDGEWMIALAVTDNILESPNSIPDFHFYRKGEEGNWYHKPGTTPVENTNAKGNIIFDPLECDRGNYKHFLGYYVVSGAKNSEVEHE